MDDSLIYSKFSLVISSKYKKAVLIILLALIQFTFIVDYILILPLGPDIIRTLGISPGEYGLMISVHTLSAAIAGFSSSFVIDKFSRKKALIFCFVFFLMGNMLVVLSNSFALLLMARIFSGAFGGVLSSMVIIYLGDIFPVSKLGRSTSAVMIANGMATVLGVPAAIYFSQDANWKFPFIILFGMNSFIFVLCYFFLPDIKKVSMAHTNATSKKIISYIKNPNFIWPVVFMAALSFAGGSTILPFLSTYVTQNFSFDTQDIALLFFYGGLSALGINMMIGFFIDKFGKQNVFLLLNFFSIVPLLLLTTYDFENKVEILAVTTMFFCLSTAKSVSGITLVNSVLPKEHRGRYITITSSVQLLASSGATILSGMLLYTENNLLMNFDLLGIMGIVATIVCIFAAFVLEE